MAMHHRFHRDIINNNTTTDDITNNDDDWWNELHSRVDFKESIVCHCDTSHSTDDDDDTKEVPTAFQSPSGRHHLLAVMEACDVSRGRAVQLTFAALLSVMEEDQSHDFATGTSTNNSNNNNEEEEERAATLLSRHLGSRELYERCVSIYKLSYLERVRVVLECLRLDQEGRANDDNNDDNVRNDNGGISEVTKYLNTIDSYYTYKSENKMKQRGILVFLLRLVGSPLPRVFFTANNHHHDQTMMSYNASQLSDNNSSSHTNKSYWDRDNDTIVALSIRKEALEALLLLLYDRLEGGVHRYDVALLLECALSSSSSSTSAVGGNGGGNAFEYLEFGMTSSDYLKSGTFQNSSGGGSNNHHRRDWILSDTTTTTTTSATAESTRQTVNELKLALNGLWGLLFGECMGLWRATTANDDNGTTTDD